MILWPPPLRQGEKCDIMGPHIGSFFRCADQKKENAMDELEQLPIPLLLWYRENARVLPWRTGPTPYRVWVSEIMLQQTRVAAVLDS